MTRPLLLDLFCGAGGAAMGYHRAGFDVVGVDIAPQPHYPFEFHQGDALDDVLLSVVSGQRTVDAIHASPPCQDHSVLKVKHSGHGTGWMLAATIDRLRESGVPWVVENVPGSEPAMAEQPWMVLCGSSFGLNLRRHRLFASSELIFALPCDHFWQNPRFISLDSRHRSLATVVGVHGHLNYSGERELREQAMGIDWMTMAELSQAIPPAYTEFIGRQLITAMVPT